MKSEFLTTIHIVPLPVLGIRTRGVETPGKASMTGLIFYLEVSFGVKKLRGWGLSSQMDQRDLSVFLRT